MTLVKTFSIHPHPLPLGTVLDTLESEADKEKYWKERTFYEALSPQTATAQSSILLLKHYLATLPALLFPESRPPPPTEPEEDLLEKTIAYLKEHTTETTFNLWKELSLPFSEVCLKAAEYPPETISLFDNCFGKIIFGPHCDDTHRQAFITTCFKNWEKVFAEPHPNPLPRVIDSESDVAIFLIDPRGRDQLKKHACKCPVTFTVQDALNISKTRFKFEHSQTPVLYQISNRIPKLLDEPGKMIHVLIEGYSGLVLVPSGDIKVAYEGVVPPIKISKRNSGGPNNKRKSLGDRTAELNVDRKTWLNSQGKMSQPTNHNLTSSRQVLVFQGLDLSLTTRASKWTAIPGTPGTLKISIDQNSQEGSLEITLPNKVINLQCSTIKQVVDSSTHFLFPTADKENCFLGIAFTDRASAGSFKRDITFVLMSEAETKKGRITTPKTPPTTKHHRTPSSGTKNS